MGRTRLKLFSFALAFSGAYWGVSMFVYNVRHPELTQMQVLMRTVEALTWQD